MDKIGVAIVIVGLMIALPLTTAQEDIPTLHDPVDTSCRGDPPLENCDPRQANEAAGRPAVITADDNMPVRTILYAHYLENIIQQAPLNTQYPDPDREEDLYGSTFMPTVYVPGETPCCKFRNNQFKLFSTAGLVEYLADGFRVHQEAGLAEPVQLAPIDGEYAYVYWYMSPESAPEAVPGDHVGVMPAVGVYAKWNLGRHPSDDARLLVGEGDTGSGFGSATPLADDQCADCVTMVSQPGETNPVYQFKVPLKLDRTILPDVFDPAYDDKEKGYFLQVIPYQVEQEQAQVTETSWRLRTGPDYAPRLVVDVQDPLVTISTRVHTFGDGLFYRWSFKSVWGTYDVDVNTLDLVVEGPDGTTLSPELVKIKYSLDHDGHFKPINATWRHDFVQEPLAPGTYTIRASVDNLQGTYRLEWTDEFTVDADRVPQVEDLGGGFGGDDPAQRLNRGGDGGDAPGASAASLVVAATLGSLLAARRRRE